MRIVLFIILLPLFSWAGDWADWQSSGVGATLNYRGVQARSAALNPPTGVRGTVTLIAWRYQLMTSGPVGLVAKLCLANRCVELDGPSGTTLALSGLPANQPLFFVWEAPGSGSFYPPLRVTSNQVIVNYTP